jgi:pimeloyl-ACP methyl ester carboxylesterase
VTTGARGRPSPSADARDRGPPRLGLPAGGRAGARRRHPGALFVELPDAGHFGFSETPEPFLRAVRAHLERVAASRRPA